ncbi:MAG TPA: P-loop NTPase [Longimicrobiales bacterium]|nr:P-loop NTPase [Longimicrobiales bacterium]
MTSRKIRTYADVRHDTGSGILEQVVAQGGRLAERLAGVERLVVVASGKGGVGKSLVAANLSAALAMRGLAVGAADADLNGPSLGRMLGVAGSRLAVTESGVVPAEGAQGVRVMSMDLLLASDEAPLRWREPEMGAFAWQSTLEAGALREFLADTEWGALDALVVDLPPGTDKLQRMLQLVPRPDALVLVTTPTEVARFVVGKSIALAREANVPRVGLVANMAGHLCEHCGRPTSLFDPEPAVRMAADAGVPLWATVPFDPAAGAETDGGRPIVGADPTSPAARSFEELADRVLQATGEGP